MTLRGLGGAPRALWEVLGSRATSFWVMGGWIALAVVWLAPFQLTGQPQSTIDGIATRWLPFRASYAAMLSATLACGLARLLRDVRRARRSPPIGRALPDEPAVIVEGFLDVAASVLEERGFEVQSASERVLAVRRRWSAISGSVFHVAVPLLAAGLVLHAATFGSVGFRLIEGQSSDPAAWAVGGVKGRWESAASAATSLTLESVEPSFYRDVLLFERLDATVRDERTGARREMSVASPLWVDPFTLLAIEDFGYAPDVQLVDSKGEVLEEVVGAMNVFPPGTQDRLRMGVHGFTVSMIVYPDHAVVDGRDVSSSFNMRNPKILLGIEQDYPTGLTRARALVGPGDLVRGADLGVRVKEIRRFGVFRVSRSYGWPLVAFAALVMAGSLAVGVLRPRQEIVVWMHCDRLAMAARIDGRSGAQAEARLLERVGSWIDRRDGRRDADPTPGGGGRA